MPELNQWFQENTAAAAMVCFALLAACAVLLIILRATQKRLDRGRRDDVEALLARFEQEENMIQSALGRYASRDELNQKIDVQSITLSQTMSELSRNDALRFDALGARLDTFGDSQERRLSLISRTLDEKLSQNDQRMETMRKTMAESIGGLQTENSKKLDEMRVTVDEKLHATLDKRLTESFSAVSKQLEQVYTGLGEMKTLASGVGDLKRVLTNVKTRGIWGEVQLGALLSQMLDVGQYEENVVVVPGSAERVEFAVRLPGKHDETPVYLPIDSKFPMEAYERVMAAGESGDPAQNEQAVKELANAVRIEGKRIAGKYISPPYTTDFAIMFLPTEGLYAEVLRCRGLTEELQTQKRIVVAGPATLSALLNSLQMGFRTLAIERGSEEIRKLLSTVKTEFGKYGDMLQKTREKIRQAGESIEDAERKTRTIEKKLRQVEKLPQDSGTAQNDALLPDADDAL